MHKKYRKQKHKRTENTGLGLLSVPTFFPNFDFLFQTKLIGHFPKKKVLINQLTTPKSF